MTPHEAFPQQELNERLSAVRSQMRERNLDGMIVAIPENIYYLTGLDHWGFFACHILIVPLDGELVIAARAMEGATVSNQVRNARFAGHADTEDAGEFFASVVKSEGLGHSRLGIEKKSLFLTAHIAEKLSEGLQGVEWLDISDLIHTLRLVQSPLEQGYTRRAAEAADLSMRGILAITETVQPGVTVGDVYDAGHAVAENAGLDDYHRHHCGYLVGIGFPASWTGGSAVTGIRRGGEMVLQSGMAFHLHSWLTETGRGDYFISNAALLTVTGCEILTKRTPESLQIR